MKKFFSDKRIVFIYVVVLVMVVLAFTYALSDAAIGLNVNTALIRIDEAAYGVNEFDSSELDFRPILDSAVETSLDNVIKIDFTVGGASTNNASDNIIYDIALNDLVIDCSLLSPYIKWKLLKNGTQISTGSLDYKFDTIVDGRLVLTETQQDLPTYSADQTGYDEYTFYMWFSDSCQESNIANCSGKADQSALLSKYLSGKVEVELYTASKKALVRSPQTTLDTSTCGNYNYIMPLSEAEVGSYVAYTGNNGCPEGHCDGTNANYVEGVSRGYCGNNSDAEFNSNGWRVAGVNSYYGGAYLISAGAPDCMCTNSGGYHLSSFGGLACDTYVFDALASRQQIREVALTYCNSDYVRDGICDSNTVSALSEYNMADILNESPEWIYNCVDVSNSECGLGNSLVDVGGEYWFDASNVNNEIYFWSPASKYVNITNVMYQMLGVRPFIEMDPSVIVVGGSGTEEDPYVIAN